MPIGLPERLSGGHTQIPLELVFPVKTKPICGIGFFLLLSIISI